MAEEAIKMTRKGVKDKTIIEAEGEEDILIIIMIVMGMNELNKEEVIGVEVNQTFTKHQMILKLLEMLVMKK